MKQVGFSNEALDGSDTKVVQKLFHKGKASVIDKKTDAQKLAQCHPWKTVARLFFFTFLLLRNLEKQTDISMVLHCARG